MDNQLKTIVFKETKEIFNRKDYYLNILPIIVISILTVIPNNSLPQHITMVISFLIMPMFGMLICELPFLRDKFSNEKLLRKIEVILTTPISIRTLWAGKMIALFLTGYFVVIVVFGLLVVFWNIINGLNPLSLLSAWVWIMSLLVMPMIPMLYFGLASWSILRFKNSKIMQILLYMGIAIGVLGYVTSFSLLKNISFILNAQTILFSLISIIIASTIVLFLISHLDKEQIIG